jgi:hypothetical protein
MRGRDSEMSARPRGPARRRPAEPVKAASGPGSGRQIALIANLAEAWLLIVGIVVAAAPHSPTWLRVLGWVGAAVALAQLLIIRANGSRPLARLLGHRSTETAPTPSMLATRDPELCARVENALTLLSGPVGQLVDDDVVASTRTAFASGIHRADELYAEEIDVRATLATLADSLRAAGRIPTKDAQYTAQQADLARLQAQRRRADHDLSAAAATLTTSLAEAAFGKQRRVAGARLSIQRRRALTSDSAPDLVLLRGGGALTDLTDAVDGVRARLDAVRELDAMTDRFAPDAAEAEAER